MYSQDQPSTRISAGRTSMRRFSSRKDSIAEMLVTVTPVDKRDFGTTKVRKDTRIGERMASFPYGVPQSRLTWMFPEPSLRTSMPAIHAGMTLSFKPSAGAGITGTFGTPFILE